MIRATATTSLRRLTRSGEIRSSGGSFGKKEQAQEDMWAHKRDLEHLAELKEKLKKAQDDLDSHTDKIIKKVTGQPAKK